MTPKNPRDGRVFRGFSKKHPQKRLGGPRFLGTADPKRPQFQFQGGFGNRGYPIFGGHFSDPVLQIRTRFSGRRLGIPGFWTPKPGSIVGVIWLIGPPQTGLPSLGGPKNQFWGGPDHLFGGSGTVPNCHITDPPGGGQNYPLLGGPNPPFGGFGGKFWP